MSNKEGWECPRCNSIWAPWVDRCKNCSIQTTQDIDYKNNANKEIGNKLQKVK